MVRVYFHLHTEYSKCSNLSLDKWAEIIKSALNSVFIITDHNTIKGAELLKNQFPEKVIVGEEIKTEKGEIIGVFLKHEVKVGLSVKETIKNIHEQGGLVVLPHPNDNLRKEVLNKEEISKNLEDFDIIEVFNSRVLFKKSNSKALELAKINKKHFIYGSDAHFLREIDLVCFEMPEFENVSGFLKSLENITHLNAKKGDVLSHLLTFLKKRNILK